MITAKAVAMSVAEHVDADAFSRPLYQARPNSPAKIALDA